MRKKINPREVVVKIFYLALLVLVILSYVWFVACIIYQDFVSPITLIVSVSQVLPEFFKEYLNVNIIIKALFTSLAFVLFFGVIALIGFLLQKLEQKLNAWAKRGNIKKDN